MKILYIGNHNNRGSDDTEGHITHALEHLGHEVFRFGQDSNLAAAMVPGAFDLLLFHHWYKVDLEMFKKLPMRKVGWYFDKAWKGREEWLKKIIPLCDLFAMTDETWARQSGFKNVKIVRQGIGSRDHRRGVPRPDRWKAKIAFTGSVYGERQEWARKLKARHGDDFQVIGDVFNRDLYDLCETVPIIVAPPYPSDDFYWSNRVYLTLGSGGFLIHPKLKGMSKEYRDGIHYVSYGSTSELERHIDFYLNHPKERDRIRLSGWNYTHQKYSFVERCRKLLAAIQRRETTGTSE